MKESNDKMTIIMIWRVFYQLIIILSVLGLGVSSCGEKCKKENCDVVNFPDSEFQKFWNFKKGSYWVYQLSSNNNVFDTMTVVDYEKLETGPCEDLGKTCVGGFILYLAHSNIDYFPKNDSLQEFTEKWRIFYEGDFDRLKFTSFSRNGIWAPSDLYFSDDGSVPSGFDITILPELEINGFTYKNVLRQELSTVDTSVLKVNALLAMTWAKNNGIIHYQLSGSRIWKLIDKNLIQ